MKKLLLLALLAIPVVAYATTSQSVTPCKVPAFVLPPYGAPLGPYCPKGGVVDVACLNACRAQYHKDVYALASKAITMRNKADAAYKEAQEVYWDNYNSCLIGGTDSIVCKNAYKDLMDLASCFAKRTAEGIQDKLDADLIKASFDFYACAEQCCVEDN